MLLLSIFVGGAWLDFIVNVMIDILYFLQTLTGFSDIIMGMTILGVSNSFVDLFINSALSAQGYDIMAVTGLFAGQMFNFLSGLGLSFIVRFASDPRSTFNLFNFKTFFTKKEEFMTFCITLASFVILVSLWIRLPFMK